MKYNYILTVFKVNTDKDPWSSVVDIGAPYHSFMLSSKEEAYEWLRENGFREKTYDPRICWVRFDTAYDSKKYRTHVAIVTRLLEGTPLKDLRYFNWMPFLHEGHCE